MPIDIDSSVAPRWYVLVATDSDEVSGDAEMTPEEAYRKNSRFASIGFPWRWVAFSEKLTPEKPLIGQRCGKTAKTHWIVFMKGEDQP